MGAEQSEKGSSERCQVTSLFHIQEDSDPARCGGVRSRIAAVVCAAKALGGHLAQAFRTFIAGWLSNRSNRLSNTTGQNTAVACADPKYTYEFFNAHA